MSRRPWDMQTMAYGAPSSPEDAPSPVPGPTVDPGTVIGLLRTVKVRARVCAMIDHDGTLKLKVYADGKLVCESSASAGATQLTVEADL